MLDRLPSLKLVGGLLVVLTVAGVGAPQAYDAIHHCGPSDTAIGSITNETKGEHVAVTGEVVRVEYDERLIVLADGTGQITTDPSRFGDDVEPEWEGRDIEGQCVAVSGTVTSPIGSDELHVNDGYVVRP
jgi:DNA/RNA endonuclease YhcR with UshA esterase domain